MSVPIMCASMFFVVIFCGLSTVTELVSWSEIYGVCKHFYQDPAFGLLTYDSISRILHLYILYALIHLLFPSLKPTLNICFWHAEKADIEICSQSIGWDFGGLELTSWNREGSIVEFIFGLRNQDTQNCCPKSFAIPPYINVSFIFWGLFICNQFSFASNCVYFGINKWYLWFILHTLGLVI